MRKLVVSPFSIAITSLGEERANLSAFRTFVQFALDWFCLFPLPSGVWEGLRFMIVALPGLFPYLFFHMWRSFYHYLFLSSLLLFRSSGRLFFVIVAFLWHLHVYFYGVRLQSVLFGTSSTVLQCLDTRTSIKVLGKMSQRTTKSAIRFLRPVKTQISLRIRAVWSESSPIACAFYNLRAIQRGMYLPYCRCTGWSESLLVR